MPIHEVERLIFELPLNGGADGEGFACAIAPGGEDIVQLAFSESRLRTFSEARPPSCSMPADAAVELARGLLRQLAPDLAAKLDAKGRPALRLVGGDDPQEAA